MGIFWSCCEDGERQDQNRCWKCSRRPAYGSHLINYECQDCIQQRRHREEYSRQFLAHRATQPSVQVNHNSRNTRRSYQPSVNRTSHHKNQHSRIRSKSAPVKTPKRVPLFGDFQCTCGRQWTSRGSWRDYYQICKYCHKKVYPHTQRELRPGDIELNRNLEDAQKDHPMELCQMCTELGYYCRKLESRIE